MLPCPAGLVFDPGSRNGERRRSGFGGQLALVAAVAVASPITGPLASNGAEDFGELGLEQFLDDFTDLGAERISEQRFNGFPRGEGCDRFMLL